MFKLAYKSLLALALTLSNWNPVFAQATPDDRGFAQRHNLDFNASLVLDASSASGVYGDEATAIIRRARFGASAEITDQIEADFTVDVDTDEERLELQEGRLKFEFSKNGDMRLGLMKQPFGMERSSSSKYLRGPERSLATDVFTPDRGIGVNLNYEWPKAFVSVGAFTDEEEQENNSIAGRIVWVPVDAKRSVTHLGLGFHQVNVESDSYRIRSDGSLHSASNFFRSSRLLAESVSTLGLEGGWMRNAFSMQSELFVQQLDLIDSNDSPVFNGGYWQAGWVLNDGRRKYKGGRFGRATAGKATAATELVFGYSMVDTRFNSDGDVAEEFTVGVHRQINESIRLSAHVFGVRLDDSGSKEDGSGVLLRMQATY